MDLEGKVALVTGASRGIGRAVALAFAAEGAVVAVNFNRDRRAAEETLAALAGKDHLLLQADLSGPEAARGLVEETVQKAGGLDIAVNNAGIWEEHPIAAVDFDRWCAAWSRILAVNLTGAANVTFCAARHMMRSGGGRIVNISSRGAFRGEPEGPAYAASKAGLNAMSQSLAKALAPHGVYVSVVAPGFVETDMAAPFLEGERGDEIRREIPIGRAARPEEVAAMVLFLASGRADFATGCIVDVNGASYLRS